MGSRDFNRPTPNQPAQAGFALVAAISIAVWRLETAATPAKSAYAD